MTTVNCSGNEELDFRLIFGEDVQQQLGPTGPDPGDSTPYCTTQSMVNQPIAQAQDLQQSQQHHQAASQQAPLQTYSNYHPSSSYEVHSSRYCPMGHLPKAFDCPSIQITSISHSHQELGTSQDAVPISGADGGGECGRERSWSRDHLYLPLDPCYRDSSSLNPSPCSSLSSRSWLSDVSSCESFSHVYDDVEAELNEAAARFTMGSPLASPLASPGCSPQGQAAGGFGVELWQQQYFMNTHSLSPHQSPRQSPRQSPCHSPRNSVTDENWLNPRPTSRSGSRPTSPCGKRRHSSADVYGQGPSPSPSPHQSPCPTPSHSPRGSVTEDTWVVGSPGAMGALLYNLSEVDIPSKTRRTSQQAHMGLLHGQGDSGLVPEDQGVVLPHLDSPADESGSTLKQDGLFEELFLSVPSHFSWNKPKPGNTPLFRTSSLPPLDWPLPSQFGQCELKVDVQPRGHHRAHYETEGSRGAVKAASGGHPVVKLIGYNEKPVNLQIFIGTADDRYLRPHVFYQVHRVTGKTVATACQESVISSTKVLEISLLPENNMSTSIDCAGILKLRNSDIELRKGETDIGRKNTRVRVAFRVYIPQPSGKVLCLQAASIPVECSQRSATDLPQMQSCSPISCLVSGGEEMVITGSNISPESKVIFLEKGPDGRTQWEVDGKVIRDKSKRSRIVVEIPTYHNTTVSSAVQVQFYVCNGKRRRSQRQNFTYLAGASPHHYPTASDHAVVAPRVKQELTDSTYLSTCNNLPGLYPTSSKQNSSDGAFSQDRPLYGSSGGHPVPCGPPSQPAYTPSGSSPLQHSPHLHSYSPSMGYQRISPMHTPDSMPPPRTKPVYQATQHNVPYSGQASSPMRPGPAALQVIRPQSAQPRPAVSSPHRESVMYQSLIGPDLSIATLQSARTHTQNATQLQSLKYHCSHSDSDLAALQAEYNLSYHSDKNLPASYSPTPGVAATCSTSPLASASSGGPLRHLSPSSAQGLASGIDPQECPPAPHSLFSNDRGRVNIKQEPEEKLPLGSMGLQEITLDDVNEIIDRDISQLSGGGGAAESNQPEQDTYGWDTVILQ
ncbi:nuclear factor of activated T-cells, cytoplasmic 3 [Salmo salar]|uniref:Nuclear factor of activated T-cells, cytoplasmic 3 n=1 Tax=Salmo salar TaxID=8030 RepID=A0A1S3MKJ4_SALSA|nr:nuclear factor of activated T-cells, cytoplasmic 3 [Salmo salar]|eukprot:XP_014003624.1 PREDICTED: nuclear factor of activated T-cells, cytoplasmic 3-like isoform X1 [Salmo salar]